MVSCDAQVATASLRQRADILFVVISLELSEVRGCWSTLSTPLDTPLMESMRIIIFLKYCSTRKHTVFNPPLLNVMHAQLCHLYNGTEFDQKH